MNQHLDMYIYIYLHTIYMYLYVECFQKQLLLLLANKKIQVFNQKKPPKKDWDPYQKTL